MRVQESLTIAAPPERVWAALTDPATMRRRLVGVTRWERIGEQDEGPGTRYAIRMQVGAAQFGGRVEFVEWDEPCDLAWHSVTGIEHRGRWRLRQVDDGTDVTFRIAYNAPGGILATIADRISEPAVGELARRALAELKQEIEGKPASAPRPSRLLEPVRRARRVVSAIDDAVFTATTLAGAGYVRPVRPDRIARAAVNLSRWKMTPAAASVSNAALYPSSPAIIDELGTLTFSELNVRTNRLANAWADAGICSGEGVGIMCRNHRGFVEAMIACSKLGAHALLMNTSFAGPQLAEVALREKPAALVYDQEFAELIHDAGRRRKRFVAWSEDGEADDPTLEALIAEGDPSDLLPPPAAGRSVILTSGTTGTPKGASRGQPQTVGPLVAILSRIPLRARERTLIAAPLFHAWGFAHLQLAFALGSTVVLRNRFDPQDTLATIAQHQVTACPMVPVMLQRILELPVEDRERFDLSALRVVPVSGSALPGDLANEFMDAFGEVLYNLYGSTEVAWATIATPHDLRAAPGTAGRAPRGTVLKILDDEGLELATGETGKIFVGNEMLFEGYTGGGTKESVGGLLTTGDLGHLDHAERLFVEGRSDDMIVSGGENVYPQEVEDVIVRHKGVQEAAVIGVPDDKFGQRLMAYVVPNSDKPTAEELKAYVKSNLARYKVPRDVKFVNELPRNSTGKVLKRELAEQSQNGKG